MPRRPTAQASRPAPQGGSAPFDGLTIGIETSDGEALAFMGKGYGAEEVARQCARLDETGMPHAFFYQAGISGRGRGIREEKLRRYQTG